jgi:hypothetical protein
MPRDAPVTIATLIDCPAMVLLSGLSVPAAPVTARFGIMGSTR